MFSFVLCSFESSPSHITSIHRLSKWREQSSGEVLPVTPFARCVEKVKSDFVFANIGYASEKITVSTMMRKYEFQDMIGIFGKH